MKMDLTQKSVVLMVDGWSYKIIVEDDETTIQYFEGKDLVKDFHIPSIFDIQVVEQIIKMRHSKLIGIMMLVVEEIIKLSFMMPKTDQK